MRVQGSTRFAVEEFFSYERLNAKRSQDSSRRATYGEEKFSAFRDPEAKIDIQGTNSNESNVTLRSAYHEHVEVTARRIEG